MTRSSFFPATATRTPRREERQPPPPWRQHQELRLHAGSLLENDGESDSDSDVETFHNGGDVEYPPSPTYLVLDPSSPPQEQQHNDGHEQYYYSSSTMWRRRLAEVTRRSRDVAVSAVASLVDQMEAPDDQPKMLACPTPSTTATLSSVGDGDTPDVGVVVRKMLQVAAQQMTTTASTTTEEVSAASFGRDAVRAGYLHKLGQHISTLKRRFFVLQPTTHLYYFLSAQDVEPRGCVDLNLLEKVVPLPTATTENGTFAFELRLRRPTVSHGNDDDGDEEAMHRIVLEARDEETGRAWIKALEEERWSFVKSAWEEASGQVVGLRQEVQDLQRQLQACQDERDEALAEGQKYQDKFQRLDHAVRLLTRHLSRPPQLQGAQKGGGRREEEEPNVEGDEEKDEEEKEETECREVQEEKQADHKEEKTTNDEEGTDVQAAADGSFDSCPFVEEAEAESNEKECPEDKTRMSKPMRVLDTSLSEETMELERMDVTGTSFGSLSNACWRLRHGLRLASTETQAALDDLRLAHQECNALKEDLARTKHHRRLLAKSLKTLVADRRLEDHKRAQEEETHQRRQQAEQEELQRQQHELQQELQRQKQQHQEELKRQQERLQEEMQRQLQRQQEPTEATNPEMARGDEKDSEAIKKLSQPEATLDDKTQTEEMPEQNASTGDSETNKQDVDSSDQNEAQSLTDVDVESAGNDTTTNNNHDDEHVVATTTKEPHADEENSKGSKSLSDAETVSLDGSSEPSIQEDEIVDGTCEEQPPPLRMVTLTGQATSRLSLGRADAQTSNNSIYHLTFYSPKIGLQFQRVPATPLPQGVLSEALSEGNSDATRDELKRISSFSNSALGPLTPSEGLPLDAVLVCGYQGFDGTNQRPALGARLVAFDGVSVEVGPWTFDGIRKAIKEHTRRPLTLSFRNDALSTTQEAIIRKATEATSLPPPRVEAVESQWALHRRRTSAEENNEHDDDDDDDVSSSVFASLAPGLVAKLVAQSSASTTTTTSIGTLSKNSCLEQYSHHAKFTSSLL